MAHKQREPFAKRTFVLVLLFAIAVAAEEQEPAPLREFIDGFRSALGRKTYDLVLPEAAAVPADARLTVEYRIGHYSVAHGILRFEPRDDGFAVTRTELGTYLPGFKQLALRGIGVTFARTQMSRARYEALVLDLLTIQGARLKLKEGADADHGGWAGTSADGHLKLTLRAGGKIRIRVDTILPIGGSRPDDALHEFGDSERALLWSERVWQALRPLEFEPFEASDRDAARLLTELKRQEDESWGQLLRIRLLGSLGYEPAAEFLETFKHKESIERDYAAVALHQIYALSSKDPKARLMRLVDHKTPALRDWAHRALRVRYPEDYKGVLLRQFRTGVAQDKLDAIRTLAKFDAKDPVLARAGLKDASGRVRIESARVLWDIAPTPELEAVFHSVARDRSLTSYEEFWARTSAVEGMSWYEPVGDVQKVRKTLTGLLLDDTEDVDMRGSAALGLGYLGDKRAIPALLEVFTSAVPEKPVYLHDTPGWVTKEMAASARSLNRYLQLGDVRQDAARALGILRAREAVDAMIAYLDQPPKKGEHNLRPLVAEALGRIASPKARKLLVKLRNAQEHEERKAPLQRHIDILDALNSEAPGPKLLALLSDRWSDSMWIVIALTETCTREQIASLRKKHPDFERVIERALKRSQ